MTGKVFGLAAGIAGAVIGVSIGVFSAVHNLSAPKPGEPLVPRLDSNGPYVLASTEAAASQYREALEEARKLHPGAAELVFKPVNLDPVREAFRKSPPRYAMVFILPGELDVNFAWQWLRLTTEVDEDPLVDVRTGFITGQDPAAAAAFVRRIRSAVENKTPLPGLVIDNFGPNLMAPKDAFFQNPGNFMIPVLAGRLGSSSISHGTNAFNHARLGSMNGAGILHFGGHGHPDRVDDGSRAAKRASSNSPRVSFSMALATPG